MEIEVKASEDQKTITITVTDDKAIGLVNLIKGLAHFIDFQAKKAGLKLTDLAISARDKVSEIP